MFTQEKNQGTDSAYVKKYESPFEVIVTGQRINIPLKENPTATTIIGNDFLKTMPRTIAVDEALKLVPGVRIDNQADGSRVHMSIRGQGILSEHGIRGIKILMDGLPLNDPTGFAPDLYDIDWQNVKKIEVLRGPAAALYGGGASGGIVNITTKNGGTNGLNGTAYSSFGSNGFWKGYVNGGGGNEDFNYQLSLSRLGGDGYRIHSAYHGTNLYSKLNYTGSDNVRLTQIISYTNYFNENPEGLNILQVAEDPKQPNPDAIPMNEFQETNRFTGGIVGKINLAENHNLQFSGYIRTSTYKEPGSKYFWNRKFFTPGGSLQYNYNTNGENVNNQFSLGTDIQWQNLDATTVNNLSSAAQGTTLLANDNIFQRGLGIFAIDRIELNNKWSFIISGRYDNIKNQLTDLLPDSLNLSGSKNFDKVTGRFGVAYTVNQNFNIYANYGQGFLPPATEELASNPVSPGGFNMNLEPSTSNGGEIGFRGTPVNEFYFDLTAFYLLTNKDFDRYRILPDRPLETFYRNAGSSRRFGLEAYFMYQPITDLKLQTAYTYSNFKYTKPDSLKDNWLPNSPEHQIYIDLEYSFLKHFTIGVSSETQSKWYIYTDKQDVFQEGFTIFNARLAYEFNVSGFGGEFSIYVKNISDKLYMGFTEPDPDGNSYQPAAGREIFGSVKFNL